MSEKLPHWMENADPGKVFEWAETLKQFLEEKFGSDLAAQNQWLRAKVEKLKLGKAQVSREQAAALLQTYEEMRNQRQNRERARLTDQVPSASL